MARSTHHRHYQLFLALLRDLREAAGMTQVALGEQLGIPRRVSKLERGERRVDAVEFVEICDALGADPVAAFAQYVERRNADRPASRKSRQASRR